MYFEHDNLNCSKTSLWSSSCIQNIETNRLSTEFAVYVYKGSKCALILKILITNRNTFENGTSPRTFERECI